MANENADIRQIEHKINALRDLVWDEDIPSPTVPEYVEHHRSIQKILKAIDEIQASLKSMAPSDT